jgi:hypothetical protein
LHLLELNKEYFFSLLPFLSPSLPYLLLSFHESVFIGLAEMEKDTLPMGKLGEKMSRALEQGRVSTT